MRKIYVIVFLVILTAMSSMAQSKSGYRIEGGKGAKSSGRSGGGGSDWMSNVFLQPNFGFAFGTGSLYLNVSPTVGYRILDGWDFGIGLSYIYSKYDDQPPYIGYSTNTIGGNLFTRYLIKAPLFVMAQYEIMGTKFEFNAPVSGAPEGRQTYDVFLAGGGIMQPVGRNGAFVASVMYNFNYDSQNPYDNGPYTSPYVVSMGFMVGF